MTLTALISIELLISISIRFDRFKNRRIHSNNILNACLSHNASYITYPDTRSTTKLFQLTCAAKGGCCNPSGFWSSRPNFFVKYFMSIASGSRNPMVIVRIFYLVYHATLKLKVIDLVYGYAATPYPSRSRSRSDSTAFTHRFSNFLTRIHRYRHQYYISSMFLAKDMKNIDISALGPSNFCAAEAGYMRNQMTNALKSGAPPGLKSW